MVVGREVDFRSWDPRFNTLLGFLKVWWKTFLLWEYFNSCFSWFIRHYISWFGQSSAWGPTFSQNPFWRAVSLFSRWRIWKYNMRRMLLSMGRCTRAILGFSLQQLNCKFHQNKGRIKIDWCINVNNLYYETSLVFYFLEKNILIFILLFNIGHVTKYNNNLYV